MGLGLCMPSPSFNLIKYLITPKTTSLSPSQTPLIFLFSGVLLPLSLVFLTATSMCSHV